jgi:Na+/H+-dicarboxylate symporter
VITALPVFILLAILDILLSEGFDALLYLMELVLLVGASLVFLILYYGFRLKKCGIPILTFLNKTGPLLRENYIIASALDAVPYNIRYCSREFHLDWKKLEVSIPVLAQINLDGNCFFLTFISLMLMLFSNTDIHWVSIASIAVLVFFLSLGAPNQPGSTLIGITIILAYMKAPNLIHLAILCEAAFGGIMNLTNIVGDVITAIEVDRAEKGKVP